MNQISRWSCLKRFQVKNLQELSEEQPVLLVFLRHFGCPFCQETLLDVRSRRAELEAKGFTIVLVYMVSPAIGQEYLEQYGMDDMEQLSDPESIAYKRFRLNRGKFPPAPWSQSALQMGLAGC